MDRHEAVVRCYAIPGQTWPSELCWMYDTFKSSRRHAEIGAYCGRSLFASCAGMQHANVLAVDIEFATVGGDFHDPVWIADVRLATVAQLQRANRSVQVTVDTQGSLQAARAAQARGDIFDSVFIDASHEYEHISGDIHEWLPLVRPGGILSGHDYSTGFIGVMDAVNEILPGFEVVPNTRIWFYRK